MRTKYNNELRIENVGEKVTLVGWCSKKRNLGGLVFIDLRDRSGIIQLVVEPDNENYQKNRHCECLFFLFWEKSKNIFDNF